MSEPETLTCTMREPNVHPDCIAAGRRFVPEGWQVARRANTCKPCNSLRNAAYRVQRAGGSTEAIEEARQRAKTGALGVAVAGKRESSRAATTAGDTGQPQRRAVEIEATFYTLTGSDVEVIGRNADGSAKLACTPARVEAVLDFTRRAAARPGHEIVAACPHCGQRGELTVPRWSGGGTRFVTHREATVGGRPRTLAYCVLAREHSVADAMRDADRQKRTTARDAEG